MTTRVHAGRRLDRRAKSHAIARITLGVGNKFGNEEHARRDALGRLRINYVSTRPRSARDYITKRDWEREREKGQTHECDFRTNDRLYL